MIRGINYDVLCKKCNTFWSCNSLRDESPATVKSSLQRFHDSDNCINCGTKGFIEIISIEDPEQKKLNAPELIETIAGRLKSHHLKKRESSSELTFLDSTYESTVAEFRVFSDNRLILTYEFMAQMEKINMIQIVGEEKLINDIEESINNHFFYGLPVKGFLSDDLDGEFALTISVDQY